MNKRTENKILKLLEKIAEQNQQIIDHLNYKGLGYPFPTNPYKPNDLFDHPWHPDRNTNSGTPYVPNNIICNHCGKDSGIAMNLSMVIPPEGLKCVNCGKVVVQSNTTTISDAPNINISSGNLNYKVTNRSEALDELAKQAQELDMGYDTPEIPSMWRYKVTGQI